MGTVIDATVPPEQFALSDTFEAVPEVSFETVRVAAQSDGEVIPFLWASAPDLAAVDEALSADDSTREVTRLIREEDRSLYRVAWQARTRLVVHMLGIERGTLLGARGENGRWELRVMFPDHDAVSSTYDFCRERDIDLSIRRVKGITDSIERGSNGLTDQQQEALTAGFEEDYYAVPRGKSLEDLADELDISHQALSERLRRGHQALIEETLL